VSAEDSTGRRAKRDQAADRHLSGKMVRLSEDLHAQMVRLAERNDRPLTREIRRVLVAALEAEGLWPPPGTST
jgi:predicted HicB family RNase H-like nuclease